MAGERWTLELAVRRLPRFRLVSRAQRLAISGASGAGKSTLLRALAGVEPEAHGVLDFAGTPWLTADGSVRVPPWRRPVAWCPQDALLLPHLSVRENLLSGRNARAALLPEIAESLEIAPLLERRPRHLSGGERHRVSLGRALLADARVLLLDEPFAALDRPLRRRVLDVVARRVSKDACSLVLVSHDPDDLSALADERWELDSNGLHRA